MGHLKGYTRLAMAIMYPIRVYQLSNYQRLVAEVHAQLDRAPVCTVMRTWKNSSF